MQHHHVWRDSFWRTPTLTPSSGPKNKIKTPGNSKFKIHIKNAFQRSCLKKKKFSIKTHSDGRKYHMQYVSDLIRISQD